MKRVSRTFDRMNPVTGGLAFRATAMSTTEAGSVADTAAEAFPTWSSLGPTARRTLLNKAADTLVAKMDDFVSTMAAEIGATEGWARFNVMLGANILREAAAITTQIGGELIPSDKPGCLAMAIRQPVGVVLAIAPWNAPVILGVRSIATALACGNSVVFKASEISPRTHEMIADCFIEAGFPAGVVGLVTNAPEEAGEVVGALIDHPEIRRINFTGSTHIGRTIAKRAAEHLKPVLLELGGKAPLLVLEDADIEEAVAAATFSAFMNQGQICMSAERIIVVESVAERFVKKFSAKAASLKSVNLSGEAAPLGALVDRKSVERVEGLVADALSKGAVRVAGGQSTGAIMPATVIDYVTKEMKIYTDESFGPVAAIIRARDEEHAIELANDSHYGLSAAVFTKDIARGLKVARRIRSGICHVNGPTVHDEPQMPFGGMGASGYGRFGGKAGIDAFSELRWITLETESGDFPI